MLKKETPLFLPNSVKLRLNQANLYVKGATGISKLNIKKEKFLFSVLKKKIVGQSIGYVVRLIFNGVGYRVESLTDETIKIKLGFSHFIFIKLPHLIYAVSPKKTTLILKSENLFILKSFVAKLRQLGPVDCYKGKGILLKNEILSLKEGKKK